MLELPRRAASLHIARVIIGDDGNVRVLDHKGEPMPELQGAEGAVMPLVEAVYAGVVCHGSWRDALYPPIAEPYLVL